MMDNAELIWKYIDGSCNPEELDLFNLRMSDEHFAADYQQALDLHGALVRDTPQMAPVDLIQQTMLRVAHEPQFKLSDISSISTKPFWVFIGGITLMSLFVMFYGLDMGSFALVEFAPELPKLIKYVPSIDWSMPSVTIDSSWLSYMIVLGILPIVYLMDRIFIRYNALKSE